MSPHTLRHDIAAGVAVAVWMLGMGLVLGVDDDSWQVAGGVLWLLGFAAAATVATVAYRRRPSRVD